MIRLFLGFHLICSIFIFNLPALDSAKKIDQYILDQWGISKGFSHDSITAFAQTGDGYLWIGTRKGLFRCNGEKFKKIDILSGEKEYPEIISCLFVAKNGVLWIGTINGLSEYKYGKEIAFKTYTTKDGLSGDKITCIREDASGNLWIGTRESYLNRFKNGTFEIMRLPDRFSPKAISSIFPVEDGTLWIGAFRAGLFKYDNKRFIKYDFNVEELTSGYSVYVVYRDKRGVLWVGTNMGLVRVHGTKTTIFTKKDGLSGDRVSAINEDGAGNLWIGTGSGLNRVIREQAGSIKIDAALQENIISCIFEDNEKSLWLGTFGSGMIRLRDSIFRTLLSEASAVYYNLPLYEDKAGDIWIGSSFDFLYKYRDGVVAPVRIEERIKNTFIYSFGEDCSGDMWIGTRSKGVYHLRDGNLTNYSTEDGLLSNCVMAIYCDSRDILWICTYKGGLSRLKDGVLKTYSTKDGLPDDKIYTIHEDRDFNLWIGTRKGIHFLKDGRFNRKTMKSYLPETLIVAIYEDEDRVKWVGTVGKGLVRLEEGKITTYTLDDGLKSKYIAYVIEDSRNHLWMSTNDGILNVSKAELNEFARGNIKKINCRLYGVEDGMKSGECIYSSRNTAIKTGGGELWFTTRKGIVILSPGELFENRIPPPVVIEKVVVDDMIFENPELNHVSFDDITNIEFHFAALTYVLPGKAMFKVKLDGYEKEWHSFEPGQARVAKYSQLPPGEYTFRVTACNRDGFWNSSGDVFTFVIQTNFFKSAIFKVLLTFLLLVLIMAVVKRVFFYRQKFLVKFIKPGKYKKTKLDARKTGEYRQKLLDLLENEKIYRDETLSLQSLAERMAIPAYQLSQIINENLQKNFYDLVNSYRVEEAKKLLVESIKNNKTILEIAIEVGFNSKSAFNRAFKKYSKMNPTGFKNKYHKKS